MRIFAISDLHLEFGAEDQIFSELVRNIIKFECDKLIIAGDFYYLPVLGDAFRRLHDLIPEVTIIAVLGNHEYYNMDMESAKNTLMRVQANLPDNCFILNNTCIEYDNVVIHGLTGWIDESWGRIHFNKAVPDARFFWKNYADFKAIRNYDLTLEQGKKEKTNLLNCINKFKDKRNIVVSHFIPCKELISTRYVGERLNYCFANDWMNDIMNTSVELVNPISYWIYGHTHDKQSHNIGGIKFVCNPVGYPFERNFSVNPYVITI